MADISEPPASGKTLPFEVVLTSGDPTHFGNDADLLLHWWYGNNVWTQARTCWDQSAEFKELAQILTKSRSTSDENEQQNLWNQAYDIVAEQVPLYPLFHSDVLTAYREDELDGYDPISAMGLDFLGATPLQDIK
jgi:peptide/nickel transport system substrate-binding protein